ncbi:hypothetical protein [Polyangium sorediatum]|uniref:DUF4435 domain-containing protein n=1 Tax=Polyangium sorediatum TaxID=889274 RepID=A0ABT6NN25_9BACT|nr:hypothetical protein [Polyangium sorediatum]MDI1429590.1 hypothetical protein [Polyangium sorediatum]
MTIHNEIDLLCEGVPEGLDVRFLEMARFAVQKTLPFAARVGIFDAGSKLDLVPSVRARRTLFKKGYVFAVSDRDFLIRPLLEDRRAKALDLAIEGEGLKRLTAYPLRRHCIESYLIEPAFIEHALGISGVSDVLAQMAERRRWIDIVRAVLEDVAYKARQARPRLGDALPTCEGEAVRIVAEKIHAYRDAIQRQTQQEEPSSLVRMFADDFDDDGSLYTRVDGKELLGELRTWLDQQGLLPGGDLHTALRHHADRHGPPLPLIEEVAVLVEKIAALHA